METEILKMIADQVIRNGSLIGEVKVLWKDVRNMAMQSKELRNPVCKTDGWFRKVDAKAIAMLVEVGITAELVKNCGYDCVRILGHNIAY